MNGFEKIKVQKWVSLLLISLRKWRMKLLLVNLSTKWLSIHFIANIHFQPMIIWSVGRTFFFSFAILYFFQNVLKNLVKTMKTCLGDDFSSADEQAWVKLAGSLVPLFEAEIGKLPKKE